MHLWGATRTGARDLLWEKLGLPRLQRYPVCEYLRETIRQAVGGLCSGARDVMAWLTESARAIAEARNVVRWTTPLGFPVVQPYRLFRRHKIETCVQTVRLIIETDKVPVAVREQVRAIAPNFIHSIDASHMFKTARACRDAGIAFADVHDQYWTHASTRPELDRLTRQEFVRLHTAPQAVMLAHEWRTRYPEIEIADPPERGAFDLAVVLNAEYFFA